MLGKKIITPRNSVYKDRYERLFSGEGGIEKTSSAGEPADLSAFVDEKEIASRIHTSNAIRYTRRIPVSSEKNIDQTSKLVREAESVFGNNALNFLRSKLSEAGVPSTVGLKVSSIENTQTKTVGLFKKSHVLAYGDVKLELTHPVLGKKSASVNVACDDGVYVITSGFKMDNRQFPINKDGWDSMVEYAKSCQSKKEPVHLVVRKYSHKFPEGYYESLGSFENDVSVEGMLRANGLIVNRIKVAGIGNAIEPLIFDESDATKVMKIAKALQKTSEGNVTVVAEDGSEEDVVKDVVENAKKKPGEDSVSVTETGGGVAVTGPKEAIIPKKSAEGVPSMTINDLVAAVSNAILSKNKKYFSKVDPQEANAVLRDVILQVVDELTGGAQVDLNALDRDTLTEFFTMVYDKTQEYVSELFKSDVFSGIATGESSEFIPDVFQDTGDIDEPGSAGQANWLGGVRLAGKGDPYSTGSNPEPTRNAGPASTKAKLVGPAGDQKIEKNTFTDSPAKGGKREGIQDHTSITDKMSPATSMGTPTKNAGPAATKAKMTGPGGDQDMWANEEPTDAHLPEGAGTDEEFLSRDKKEQKGNVGAFLESSGEGSGGAEAMKLEMGQYGGGGNLTAGPEFMERKSSRGLSDFPYPF